MNDCHAASPVIFRRVRDHMLYKKRLQVIGVLSVLVFSIPLVIVATTLVRWRLTATASSRVLAKGEWPETLKEFLQDAEQRHVRVAAIGVYSGPHGAFYWKCESAPDVLNLMIERWRLHSVSGDYSVARDVARTLPPTVALSRRNGHIDYYVSAEYLPDGEWKGHLYCVMNDKTSNVIVVRYYYSF